ncbi:MAG: preprotein translocase subunit YajC [Oscillospiraceae bacterium]|nr:preprotein translocase subunit YajC [Oscillospiraceae bacterium]
MHQYVLFFGGGEGDMLGMMMPLILMVAIFYLLLIRPQKKREKAAREMRNSVEVGDEILTIGGILGRVVAVKDDTLLIESGSANTKLRITKGAVQSNVTATEKMHERQQEAAKAAAAAKERKKAEKSGKTVETVADAKEKELEKKMEKE